MPTSRTARRNYARSELPYGLWCLENGREILFNRAYQPIWERSPDANPQPANRNEWVQGAGRAHVTYLYDDSCVPYQNKDTMRRCELALQQFQTGEPITPWKHQR